MKKILIIEDDKYLSSALKIKFEKTGYEAKVALDGDEVTQVLAAGFIPDIMLLDLVMPKKDGFSVLESLKASDQWKNIPVVIASNLGQKEDIDRGMGLGAKDYIVKSEMTLADIVAKIRSILESQVVSSATPPTQ